MDDRWRNFRDGTHYSQGGFSNFTVQCSAEQFTDPAGFQQQGYNFHRPDYDCRRPSLLDQTWHYPSRIATTPPPRYFPPETFQHFGPRTYNPNTGGYEHPHATRGDWNHDHGSFYAPGYDPTNRFCSESHVSNCHARRYMLRGPEDAQRPTAPQCHYEAAHQRRTRSLSPLNASIHHFTAPNFDGDNAPMDESLLRQHGAMDRTVETQHRAIYANRARKHELSAMTHNKRIQISHMHAHRTVGSSLPAQQKPFRSKHFTGVQFHRDSSSEG